MYIMMRFYTVFFLILWTLVILVAGESRTNKWYMFNVLNETINSTANEQFLSKLSLPLRVRISSTDDVRELISSLLFMDKNKGKCPFLSFWELLREVFQPNFLEETYGVRRFDAIQALLSDENNIYTNTEEEILGFIEMKGLFGNETIRVYFRDIDVKYGLHNQPYIEVNVMRQVLRKMKREKKQQIKEYSKEVEKNHNILRRIHYSEIVKEQRQRLHDIQERKSRALMMNQLREFRKKQKQSKEYNSYVIPVISTNKRKGNFSLLQLSRRCDNIRHAIETLQSQNVVPNEKRMQYLLTLEKKYCETVTENIFFHNKKLNNEVCDSRCPLYCNVMEKLQEWMIQSGSSLSIAQLQTLYHVILLNTTGYNNNEQNGNYFSHFRQLVLDDINRGIFSSCSGICTLSTNFRSEIKFFAGIMELLDDTSSNKEKSIELWWRQSPMAYLRIWEAAHTGSKSAIVALATMKEHGILSPQQTQIAARLISSTISESSTYFWKQILTTKTNNFTNVNVSADKLLRFERFLGVENSWSEINEPYITRSRLSAISTDFDSSREDENSDTWTKNEVSSSLLRGMLMAQLYIAGIKGMPRDLQRAECILLSLLRKLRYTCDVKHPEKDDKDYFSKDGRGGGCDEHIEALYSLRRNEFRMGVCASNVVDSTNKHLRFKVLTQSKKVHLALHDILVLLSYIQLLNGMKRSLAAEYAFQAVEVGAAVFHAAMSALPTNAEQLLLKANRSNYTKLKFLKQKKWPAISLCRSFMEREGPEDALSDLTRSGFLSQESLLLLALAGRGGPYPQMAVERLFGTSLCSSSSSSSSSSECDGRVMIFLLREAGRLWREAAAGGGTLVLARPDPHRADPLLLLAWLLPRLPADALNSSAAGRWAAVGDTRESYAATLRHMAESIAPLAAPTRVGNIPRKSWELARLQKASQRRLQLLRTILQRQFEEHQFNPLLYTSDIHSYLNYTQWTWFQRVFGMIQDTLLFPFTNTEVEFLEENLAKEIIPVKNIGGIPFDIAEQMAASVIDSENVREVSIALQLVAMSLMSGEPDGFTFILIEEMNRGNGHLRSIAYYISEHVWGRRLGETWIELHKTAQWQNIKPKTKRHGILFGLDPSMPFSYGSPESMMELFVYVTLKRVNIWQQGITLHNDSSVNNGFIDSKKINNKIFRALGMCSGVLIEFAMRKGRPFPPRKPYEGMYRPVGNSLCLRHLLQHIRHTRISPFPRLSSKEAEMWVLDMLTDLTIKQARYYGISLNGSSSSSLVDSDFAEEDEQWLRKHLVEPWHRVADVEDEDLPLPQYGEGAYYNRRLHTLTGTYYAASLQKFYMKLKNTVMDFISVFGF